MPEAGPPIHIFEQILAQNYSNVALVALLFWDHILTLEREFSLVWSTRWSLGKMLFLLNRYIPPLNLLVLVFSYTYPSFPQRGCRVWSIIDDWLSWFALVVVDILLILRTTAMWDRKRSVQWVLAGLFTLTFAGMTAAVVNLTVTTKVEKFPPSIRPGCITSFSNIQLASTFFYSALFFNTGIVLLMLGKLVPLLRAGTLGPLLRVLHRDGYVYAIIIFLTATANITMLQLGNGPEKAMIITLHRVSSVMMCSRMVLNMRSLLLEPTSTSTAAGDVEMELTRVSVIDFAQATTRTDKSSAPGTAAAGTMTEASSSV